MGTIRRCRDDERAGILAIVNAAAEAYCGVIPEDCRHEPYMTRGELDAECAAGVAFWGYEERGTLVGVMGIQRVGDVQLIRHAYVAPIAFYRGNGFALEPPERSAALLRTYWSIPERQIETSVVLARWGPAVTS